ncbi:peptidase inhibitor family I36 protein [Streptomyces sp. NPDC002463]|uniref:peptidase inhibitor family I36 protein n=1 Tax=Streptomyces sp. NPDC002463 TaxID=3364645 RepID=UPI0036CC8E17
MAAGVAVTGTATPASATDGGCDSALYEFCAYAHTWYGGASCKVAWGQADWYVTLPDSLRNNVSSVVNNTNYEWALAHDSGQIIPRVGAFHHLSSLGAPTTRPR